jgi:hypothetical protein
MEATEPERLLKRAGRVLEQPLNLVRVIEVIPTQDPLPVLPTTGPTHVRQRIGLDPALAPRIVKDGGEDVAVLVARLRRRRSA